MKININSLSFHSTKIPKKETEHKKLDSSIFSSDLTKDVFVTNSTTQKASEQIFSGDEFFIDMKGYGKNKNWQKKMEQATYDASNQITCGMPFDSILKYCEHRVNKINLYMQDLNFGFGVRRKGMHCFRLNPKLRGAEYYDRYHKKASEKGDYDDQILELTYSPKSNDEYPKANTCTIVVSELFTQPKPNIVVINDSIEDNEISNLALAKEEYQKLKKIKNPSCDDVMRSCAIIQWLIAQETPYYRGSDSIANLLTKSIMHANRIHISPVKSGISLDFEAFDTDLDEYIENYPNFFKERPYKIKNNK